MSTLSIASSPSPAISPRHSFHSGSSRGAAPLLPSVSNSSSSGGGVGGSGFGGSNNITTTSQAHRINNPSVAGRAPPATLSPRLSAHASAAANASSQQQIRYYHSSAYDAPRSRRVQYVDSSTQYSPECLPSKSKVVPGSSSKSKKREVDRVVASNQVGDPMTGIISSSHSSTRAAPSTAATSSTFGSTSSSDKTASSKEDADAQYTGPRAVPSSSIQQASPLQEARSTDVQPSASKRSRPDPATCKTMPYKYELCSPKDLGALISNMLMELIRINDKIPLRDGRLTRFHSRAPPGISVSDYLQRLIQHATLSPPILLSMVYYIDRLCTMYPAFTINSLTVHRFLITAATVAAKGLSDSFWTNPTYARIGGIPVPELATLELELLQRVQWKIVPKPEALEDYYYSLVERTDGYVLEEVASESSSSDSSQSAEASSGIEQTSTEKSQVDKQGDSSMSGGPT